MVRAFYCWHKSYIFIKYKNIIVDIEIEKLANKKIENDQKDEATKE